MACSSMETVATQSIGRLVAGVVLALGCLSSIVGAGEYNEVLSIGDAAPAWTDLPGVDGKRHSLVDLKSKRAVVVIFTCVTCPTAVDYEERIQDLTKRFGGTEGPAAVVAICVNRTDGDRLPALTARAKEKQFAFDYLYDESQEIAQKFGAVFTPEFYVLDGERRVVYMGAMDDRTDAAAVTQRYVEQALASILDGKPLAVKETPARGCRVRYQRPRGG